MTWTSRPLAVAIVTGAAYRVTRLLTSDPFPPVHAARSRLEDLVADRAPQYAHGVTCSWCVGFWVAVAVVAGVELAERRGRLGDALLAALPWAVSAVVGAAADREIH